MDATATLGVKAMTAIIQNKGNIFVSSNQGKKYIVDDRCTKCGTCAKVCPSGNISVTDKVHFSDKCEGCLGCIHLCPKNALHLKNEKSRVRWKHPDVSSAEIIKANNRGAK